MTESQDRPFVNGNFTLPILAAPQRGLVTQGLLPVPHTAAGEDMVCSGLSD